jgi:hypothetical protein
MLHFLLYCSRVRLGLEVQDDFVFGDDLCLKGGCLGVGLLEELLQGGDLAGEGLQGFQLFCEGIENREFGHDGVYVPTRPRAV